ncbi:MAG TPA: dihydroorotase [Acidobacteriaceae bacterium]|jgi:dihydroorotase|nr:dihydroorotase [Acidobacteriaceae bacterium]
MTALLIRGGHLIDPVRNIDAAQDIFLRDGRVAAVEAPSKLDALAAKEHAEIVVAKSLIVAPGLVDIHVHLREPGQGYKETIATGTAAAAAGGFTSVCAMPNTIPVNDSVETTRWMQSPEREALVRVFPIAAATRGSMGEALTEYGALKAAGAVAVSDDGKPILQDAVMHQALAAAARIGVPVIQHAEDTHLTQGASMNAGALAFRLGLRGMSAEAESNIVERDIQLLAGLNDSRAHLHVAHLSTAKALDAVRKARRNGLHVTCEVTPHHFALTEEAIGDYDTHAKMSPPLRLQTDRTALIEGLLDGSIDAIATDHAPHAIHEKEQEFERTPNGILGLETALGLSLLLLHRKYSMPFSRVLALLSAQPANVLHLSGRGTLAVGAFADVVLFDPQETWTYRAAESKSKSRNTPFDGWAFPGRVHLTISEGRIVHDARKK